MKGQAGGQFTRFSINTIAVQFILLFLSVITSILTARVLGPEARGQLTLVLLIPMMASTLGRAGIGHAVNYYAGKTSDTGLIFNSFILSTVISAVVVAVTVPSALALKAYFFKPIENWLIVFISLSVPLYLFSNHFITLIQGFYKINLRNLLLIIQSASGLVFLFILLVVFKMGLNGAVFSTVAALLAIVLLSGYFLLKEVDTKELKADGGLMKKLLSFGFKSHIGNILKDLSYRGDILILGYFLPSASIGYYIIAVTVAEMIWRLPDSIGGILLPRIAKMKKESARDFTPQVCRITLLPVIVVCIGIVVFSTHIITIAFGQEYIESVSALKLLVPGIVSFSVWKILANDLIAQGYPSKYSLTSGVGLVFMIVFDLLLIPSYGINGAAIASSISYICATVCIIAIYVKITNNKASGLIFPVKEDFMLLRRVVCELAGQKR